MSDTPLLIGVDGGKTKTITVLGTLDGDILAVSAQGPCNHIHEPGGLERQFRVLQAGYHQVFERAGLPLTRLQSVYLGLSGSGHLPTVETVYDAERLTLASDLPTALSGAIPSMHGLIVIGGTGSAAFGRNAAGQEAIAGGQGYYAGDEGGGYWIAQAAFRAAYQAVDGRSPETMLTDLILKHYGSDTLRVLRDRIYGELTRDQLAAASRLVGIAAQHGDAVALRILGDAGTELGRLAVSVLRQLDWLAGDVPVASVGGVFNMGLPIVEPMMAHIQAVNPAARLHVPQFPPAIGAFLLARRALGLPVDDTVLANVERTEAVIYL